MPEEEPLFAKPDEEPVVEPLTYNFNNEVSEDLFITECGCIVVVNYEYLQITLDEIDGYKRYGMPMPEGIYRTWDIRNRALLNATKEVFVDRFDVEDSGNVDPDTGFAIPVTVYNRPDLIGTDVTIIGVTIEGQGIDETNPVTVNVDTVTGDVTFGIGLTVGQKVKIEYKK